ncbi:MAG: hypothetical protein WDN10_03795 [bacterium]
MSCSFPASRAAVSTDPKESFGNRSIGENDSIADILGGIGNERMKSLSLNGAGKSARSDLYAKESDVIDEADGNRFYASFMDEMDALKSAGTIRDWKAAAYDWRLSLPDIIEHGTLRDGMIFYEEATSTPYIEQTLHSLAATSKSGRVTVIAHSNGGLVAKALMEKLGGEETARLIDKVILVGVPQSGAPGAVGALLYGLNQGIAALNGIVPVVSADAAREFAQNAPMAYHLLPSEAYFSDSDLPVGQFEGEAYAAEEDAYGEILNREDELAEFLSANNANESLLAYASATHDSIDAWQPPAGTAVYELAGFGVDSTVSGIDFYTLPRTFAGPIGAETPALREYRPLFTPRGDGVVPSISALMMDTGARKYWIDLAGSDSDHGTIFEHPDVRAFIESILTNTEETPASIVTTEPVLPTAKKLLFFLHSPLALEVSDGRGRRTGLTDDGRIREDIPGSTYGEFGEVKYSIVPAGRNYEIELRGTGSGTFSVDLEEQEGDRVIASSTIYGVPVRERTRASMKVAGDLRHASALIVDEDGDGMVDIEITPRLGEAVPYSANSLQPTTTSSVSDVGRRSSESAASHATATTAISLIPGSPVVNPARKEVALVAQEIKSMPIENTPIQRQERAGTANVVRQTQTASVYGAFDDTAFRQFVFWLKAIWQKLLRLLRVFSGSYLSLEMRSTRYGSRTFKIKQWALGALCRQGVSECRI